MEKNEEVRLAMPAGLSPEDFRKEWGERVVVHGAVARHLTFLDTFEWGVWFGGFALALEKGACSLFRREGGWCVEEVCSEAVAGQPRRWGDFRSEPMLAHLPGLLGLRGLMPVAEATLRRRLAELRNEMGKIVCRMETLEVFPPDSGGGRVAGYCRVLPLLGYEREAAQAAVTLRMLGAEDEAEGPLECLLKHAGRTPKVYTLRPAFGLEAGQPAREAVARIVRTALSIARSNEEGMRADLDTEFLHDYRICLRKMRSVLSLMKGVYPEPDTERLKSALGDLARATNRLRDLDVYLMEKPGYLELLPPRFRAGLEEMFTDFEAERVGVFRRTASHLRSLERQGTMEEIEAFFREGASLPLTVASGLAVGPMAFGRIYKRYRKVCRIAGALGPETPDEAVHGLRIECKKLRYLMEFFSEIVPAENSAILEGQLKRLQNRLGEFNDCSVQEKFLIEYWETKKSAGGDVSGIALALGGLVTMLHHRRQEQREKIRRAIEEFCSPGTVEIFKQTFRDPAASPANASA